MDMFFYNKSGRVAAYIARDCLIMDIGDRLPTISDYCERFGVSRGIVQNALNFLQEEGCITVETSGAKGSWLSAILQEKLVTYTGWDSFSLSMPLPFDIAFSSLSTAINESLRELPLPASFAYISGSTIRIRFLEQRTFDFSVFSLNTANHYSEDLGVFDPPVILEGCTYSYPFALYIKGGSREIQDGMRMVHDPTSYDHEALSQRLAKGKKVSFIKLPYVAFSEVSRGDLTDCLVVRQEPWTAALIQQGFQEILLEDLFEETSVSTTTPALLTHKRNYGMHRLLLRHFDIDKTALIQQEIFCGKRPPGYC